MGHEISGDDGDQRQIALINSLFKY